MRSYTKNECEGGQLNDIILQPIFMAGPGHHAKVMCKKVFGMVPDTKDPGRCKAIGTLRLKNTQLVTSARIEPETWTYSTVDRWPQLIICSIIIRIVMCCGAGLRTWTTARLR